MEKLLTVIIPVYNEATALPACIKEVVKYTHSATVGVRFLFIDDGSTDVSAMILERACKDHKEIDALYLSKNYGLSTALKAGIEHSTTTLTGYMDADLQTHPEDFNSLLAAMGDAAMVTGIRSTRNDNFIKRFVSRVSNGVRRLFTNDGITDTGCPLKILNTENAKKIPLFTGMHRFLPALIQLQGATVVQVEIPHYKRVAGTSKFGIWNRLFVTIVDCFAYLWIKRRYVNYELKQSTSER